MSMPATANTDITSAIAEAQARFTAANPKSQAQLEKAAKVLPGGNTRTVLFYPPFPLIRLPTKKSRPSARAPAKP